MKILLKNVLTDDDWECIETTALASDGGKKMSNPIERSYHIEEELLRKIINNEEVDIRVRYITGEYGYGGKKIADCEDIVFKEATDNFIRVESKNIKAFVKTNYFLFIRSEISSLIPAIDFETGEIKDKPGTFLDFNKPESLDDQLAEIYGLTVEEQELMKNSIKPWKDKYSLTADGLY